SVPVENLGQYSGAEKFIDLSHAAAVTMLTIPGFQRLAGLDSTGCKGGNAGSPAGDIPDATVRAHDTIPYATAVAAGAARFVRVLQLKIASRHVRVRFHRGRRNPQTVR